MQIYTFLRLLQRNVYQPQKVHYENADQMYRIGKKTMLRYAARRGKREEIEKLIEATML